MMANNCNLSKFSTQELRSIVQSFLDHFGDEGCELFHAKAAALKQCWIVSLPAELACTVLSMWIHQRDFVRVDSAFCTTKHRPTFLQWCAMENMVLAYKEVVRNQKSRLSQAAWVHSRRVHLSSYAIYEHEYADSSLFVRNLSYSGRTIQRLTLDDGDDLTLSGSEMRTMITCCPNLRHLSCPRCDNDDEAVSFVLKNCKQLKVLHKESPCNFPLGNRLENSSTDRARWTNFPTRLASMPIHGLEEVRLTYDDCVTDTCIAALTKSCPYLRIIDLSYCAKLTDSAIQAIAEQCPKLTELFINRVSVSDAGFQLLGRHCPALQVLEADYCHPGCADQGILSILRGCPALTRLWISGAEITDAGIHDLHTLCPHLQSLSLRACTALTPVGVLRVIEHCAVLSDLCIEGFSVDFDLAVRQELYARKLWLGRWKDRNLKIRQTSAV